MSADRALLVLSVIAALGCGLIGGVFFAFSTFIMKALTRLPNAQAIAAMQSINVVVLNRWFLTAFMGTGAVCAVIVVWTLFRWPEPASYLLVGSVLYLVGTLLVTIVCNVPRNEVLAKVSPTDPQAEKVWITYLARWTAWNHVRTVAALAAAVSFSLALAS